MSLELFNITKSFNNLQLFRDFNLKIDTGEFVTILGKNGIGKTTLLKIISKLDLEFSGKISASGTINYNLQKPILLPWLKVYDNVILGLKIQKRLKNDTKEKVIQFFKDFELDINLFDCYTDNLSGGEQQKIALIRTLILEGDIILLDEAFSAMDFKVRLEQQIKLYQLSKKYNKTVIFITHNIDEALNMSDRILVFKNNPIEIVKDMKVNFGHKDVISNRTHSDYNQKFTEIWKSLN